MSRKTGKEVRMDFYGFYTGTEFEAYDYLGAHMEGGEGIFRTFAPGAKHIAVIGDFNQWTAGAKPGWSGKTIEIFLNVSLKRPDRE